MHNHIVNQIKNSGLRSENTLYCVLPISNPVRYHSRYRLGRDTVRELLATPSVHVHLVEAAFGDRSHEVAPEFQDSPNFSSTLLRTSSEAWIKENCITLGARDLIGRNPGLKYLAWIDADVTFRDPNWAQETMHQLQHFQVVQPWQSCSDLGPLGNVFKGFKSFGFQHQMGIPKQMHPSQPYEYAHSGFAWACTRLFWENVGGLMDFGILGSGDHHMAFAMIGEVKNTIHAGMSDGFKRLCAEWQDRAVRVTKKQVGFTPGRIEHHFHGPKKRRYYRERWEILVEHGFDPVTDLMRDSSGLLHLVGKPDLEQAIRRYNRSRWEDSIEES